MKAQYELADIIRQYGEAFTEKYQPLHHHRCVLQALQQCRTAALGGHVDGCDNCGHLRISYNSCRNRHCPKCQNTNREKWIEKQQRNLLPVTYFHVVFTLPQEINSYCIKHPKELYNLLFQCSRETIETFAADNKHLGAQPGTISVLHTWGQNLSLHPHVHMIVPGGGITDTGLWQPAKSKGRYLFPVKAMSVVFKNKFMQGLLLFIKNKNDVMDKTLRQMLYDKNWIVYAKQPFGGPQQVIEYLGRYSHKVAISNHRIRSIKDGKVSFTYKDYADQAKQKEMTLDAEEFLRRFCLHILPRGFRKIRHTGFLSNRSRTKLKMQQMRQGVLPNKAIKKDWQTISKEKLGFDAIQCPCCKKGSMQTLFSFDANGPPKHVVEKIKQQQIAKTAP